MIWKKCILRIIEGTVAKGKFYTFLQAVLGPKMTFPGRFEISQTLATPTRLPRFVQEKLGHNPNWHQQGLLLLPKGSSCQKLDKNRSKHENNDDYEGKLGTLKLTQKKIVTKKII